MSHHRIAVGPSEVPLEHLVVEAEPLVVASQTCAGVGGEGNRKTGQAAPGLRRHLQRQTPSRSTWDAGGARRYVDGNSPFEGLLDLPGIYRQIRS